MRFFCRFKGEQAQHIKALFNAVGIGRGEGSPSIRDFTKTAVLREIKNLQDIYAKQMQAETDKTQEVKEEVKEEVTSE